MFALELQHPLSYIVRLPTESYLESSFVVSIFAPIRSCDPIGIRIAKVEKIEHKSLGASFIVAGFDVIFITS